jgi:hypothetical protein
LAVYVLRFEDVVVGSYGGSLPRLLRERFFQSVRKGSRPATSVPRPLEKQ